MKSTNYYNTFIEVSEDCPVTSAEIPPTKGEGKSAALLQFEMIYHHPYKYSMDDVVFGVYATKNSINFQDTQSKEMFFSKGQPCLRASALGKRYGWGIHCDENGKMAIYPVESEAYQAYKADKNLTHLKAMRTSKQKTISR